jgi:uncharacterized Zn-binding protein involved in type VI secretion
MSQAATLTSVGNGQCCCHNDPTCIPMIGVVISASPDIFINGLPAARMGDLMQGTCGHFGTIVSGASDTFSNGIPAARLGDITHGCLLVTLISGSTDVQIA